MRNPTPYASLLNDAPPADVDGADADLDLCPDGGLCWPDDPLDSVIGYMSMLDDGFLEGLGLGSSPPPGPVGDGQDYSRAALEGMKADADLGSLAEERPLSLRDAGAPGGRKRSASYVFDSKPEGLPPARARSLSCSTTITSSSTASGSRSLSPTSGGTESPREPASGDDDLRWTLPRKPHHRRTVRRRAPSWSFALPPPLMSAAAAYRCHGDSNANDDKDKDYVLSRCKKGRGNGGPRRARRQQKKTEDKICTHCHAAETPQWRAGPAGSSTLCNACGIRYKMGKLFPEYRPSTSPHFSSLEHSNRHRNVERIRDRKKKLKVMSPELPVSPDADDKLLLESVNMKCS